jgi:acetyl-CoA synthetase
MASTKSTDTVTEGAPSGASSRWDDMRAELSTLPDGAMNIGAACSDRHVAAGHGERIAVRCLGSKVERRDISYAALADRSSRLAAVLTHLGIEPGDTVAVLLRRVPELFIAALGTLKAGGVFCPLFATFGPGPIRSRLDLAQAKVLIVADDLYARKIASNRDSLPDLKHVLLVGEDGDTVRMAPDCLDFAAMIETTAPSAPVATRPVDPAFLHFTSGTTGTPKGVVHPHRAILAHLITGRELFGLTPSDIFWCTADPGWITSTAYGIIAPLACGATVLADEADINPRRWYGILADEKVTAWYTTPTAIRAMMRFGAALARSYRDNSLRIAASVGEPLNTEAVLWGQKALGVPFLDTWWQTEIGSVAIANLPGEDRRPGSMGRILPGIQSAVVRREGMHVEVITTPDTVGELAIRPGWPSMLSGYVGDGVVLGPELHDGWYLTGDLVRRDSDGFHWFVGRADDMIKCGGLQIGPFEVEGLLMNHPALAEVGVVGKPDLLLREVPVAFASLNPGFQAGDALRAEVLTFARQELGPTMAPRELHFIPELPKTIAGKILRRVLKAKAVEEPEEAEPLLGRTGAEG